MEIVVRVFWHFHRLFGLRILFRSILDYIYILLHIITYYIIRNKFVERYMYIIIYNMKYEI